MLVRTFIKKRIDLPRLLRKVDSGAISGLHFHRKGKFDVEYDIIEMVLGRNASHTFAVKLYLDERTIKRIERVKFEWMCGGWRSKDVVLTRFPRNIKEYESEVEGILHRYAIKGKKDLSIMRKI